MRSTTILALAGATVTMAQTYSIADTYEGSNFFNQFDFYTGADPTDGFVNYLDYQNAQDGQLIPNTSVPKWGVDSGSTISTTSSGRSSIRLSSTATYNHGLFIADIVHMPGSICGVWPAYWLLGGGSWPAEGEIDIIEGVNTGTTNTISGHTTDGCTITNTGSATISTTDCDSTHDSDTGCSMYDLNTNSYGNGFNANGGGVYAVEWTSSGFQIWFFQRGSLPSTLSSANPDPSQFGTPVGTFTGSGCDFDSHFSNMQIIIDTTFCGDWAGDVFSSTCSQFGSCASYVANNPTAFNEAYWEFNSIKVYTTGSNSERDAAAVASPTSSTTTASATSTSTSTSIAPSTTLQTSKAVETAATNTATFVKGSGSRLAPSQHGHGHSHYQKRHGRSFARL